MSIKFTYNEDKNSLVIKDDNKTTVFKLHDNKYDELFKYVLRSIDQLDGGDEPIPPVPPEPESTHKIIDCQLKTSMYLNTDISMIDGWNVSAGQYVPLVENGSYSILFNDVTYNNITCTKLRVYTNCNDSSEYHDILYIGNIAGYYINTESGRYITPETRATLVDNNLPFCIMEETTDFHWVNVWTPYNGNDEYITVDPDNDATYTICIKDSMNNYGSKVSTYTMQGGFDDNINRFGAKDGRPTTLAINGVTHQITWQEYEENNDGEYTHLFTASFLDSNFDSYIGVYIVQEELDGIKSEYANFNTGNLHPSEIVSFTIDTDTSIS